MFVVFSVKYLGKFHSKTYALKLTEPDKIPSLVKGLQRCRFVDTLGERTQKGFDTVLQRLAMNIEKSDLSNHIPVEFSTNLIALMRDMVKLQRLVEIPVEPFATLCHGDFVRTNLAFKYDDKSPDSPIDIKLYDFQCLVYASPMLDLSTFMAISVDSETRFKHFHAIFKAYVDSLIENTSKNSGIPIEELPDFLEYTTILKEFIKYRIHAIRIATFFLILLIEPVEDFIDNYSKGSEALKELNLQQRGGDRFDKEMQSLVLELYNLTNEYNVDIFEYFRKLEQM